MKEAGWAVSACTVLIVGGARLASAATITVNTATATDRKMFQSVSVCEP